VVNCAIIALLLVFSGADIEPQGFVDTYHAARLSDPNDYLSSRTRLRLETWITGDEASGFVSMNAISNNVIESNSGIELREAYIDYAADSWDMRTGRQIIVWGKADGLTITDIISPGDYTEFLARDFDDIRTPVDVAKFRLLFDDVTLELLWLPVFKPAILPPAGTPWSYKSDIPGDVNIAFDAPVQPEVSLRNSEVAGKISFYLPGVDIALSSFYTWNDYPTLHRTVTNKDGEDTIHFHQEYHRLTFAGAEFSIPWKDFVLRGEGAFYNGRSFEHEDIRSEILFERNSLDWMMGLDWSPGNSWALSCQFADDIIFNYDDKIKNDPNTMLVTLNISKKLLRETLTLSKMSYFGINKREFFVRTSGDYSITDGIYLLCGIDLFFGDKGTIGQYDNNDEFWVKVKYAF
jgi:hypothetical protein